MLIKHIAEKDILGKAFFMLKNAKKSLHLTMIMQHELHSVSADYIDLLRDRIASGLFVKRIGFGTREQYLIATKQFKYSVMPVNFQFRYTSNKRHVQRMLLADESKLLFAVYSGSKKFVFYTSSPDIVQGFLKYHQNIFSRSTLY